MDRFQWFTPSNQSLPRSLVFVGRGDDQTRSVRRLKALVVAAVIFLCCTAWRAEASDDRHQLLATVHVHSTASTGELTVEALAERAERLGLDVLMLTDNFSLRYEYGL